MEKEEELFFSEDSTEAAYKIIKKIGKGTYSTVYLCENIKDKKEYAIKVHYDTTSIIEKKRSVIINDAYVISKVQGHPNIINLKEVFMQGRIISTNDGHQQEGKRVFAVMVMETCKGGELFYHIRKCGSISE
jgi:serine/threonine protein kinase